MSVCESRIPRFSILLLILSTPPLPNQLVFDSISWSYVNPAREKENGDVPVVIPKWSIAARLPKLRTGLITYLTVILRQSPSPIISLDHVTVACFPQINRHSKIMGLIGFSCLSIIRRCYWACISAYSITF